MTAYATPLEVRMAGIGSSVTDARIQSAINFGQTIVDSVTGADFRGEVTEARTFSDVRNQILVLPVAFSAITSVNVAGYELAAGQWQVESWGLRLFPWRLRDASGLPMIGSFDLSYGGPFAYYGDGYTVTVAATWGFASVPYEVKEATILLALDRLASSSTSGADPTIVSSLSVEGYSVTYRDTATMPRLTTGNVTADRLLARFRANESGLL